MIYCSFVRAEDDSRSDSPSALEVICRQLRDEYSGLLKECAELQRQVEARGGGRRSMSSSASSLDVEEDMFVEPPEHDRDGSTKASSESGWRGSSQMQRKNRSRKVHKLQLEDKVSKAPITASTTIYVYRIIKFTNFTNTSVHHYYCY
nr:unnamed protein product [Callosobruchus analis]